jgi:transposase
MRKQISRDSQFLGYALFYHCGMKRNKKPTHRAPDPATLAPKASGSDLVLHSRTIGALPIINRLIERCRLRETLSRHLPAEDGRNRIDTANAVLLLVRNILISREPLYGVGQWAAAFVPELLQLREDQLKSLNDDRVGRALDRLFDANFPDLVMDITRSVIKEFSLDLSELHNDSTTIRFFGDYDGFDQPQIRRGKATVAIRQGHSKDHRPDLKQLLYILTVTDDGGVPVYFTTDNGDRNDDVTHVPTWDLLHQLTGRADFLYIADCKLASAKNLGHIDRQGGRFITILPKNRTEPRAMNKTLMENPESLRWVLLYEVEDDDAVLRHRFKSLREEQVTGDGYRLLWIHSMSKAISDDASRMKSIQKTIEGLSQLRNRLQSPRSRMRDRPRVAGEVDKIMERRGTADLMQVEIIQQEEVTLKQKTPGRRSENTQYVREVKLRFDLTWQIDAKQLERARQCDGIFPLITNDRNLTAEEVLRAYKRQPIIEKRFSQFKSDFHVAPVYLKEVSRIESLLCVYFMALLLQTLLERELRRTMAAGEITSLPLYPEARDCRRPTARRVIDALESISRHRLVTEDGAQQDLYTDPTPLQRQLIKLFGNDASTYGRKK